MKDVKKRIITVVLLIVLLIAIFFFSFSFGSHYKEVDMATSLQGKTISFPNVALYEGNGFIKIDNQSKTIWTSDIDPNRIVAVTQREYDEQASHIKTVDVPSGTKFVVVKEVSSIDKSGFAPPMSEYYLREPNGEVVKMYAYELDAQSKTIY